VLDLPVAYARDEPLCRRFAGRGSSPCIEEDGAPNARRLWGEYLSCGGELRARIKSAR